ncbi:hypothetical protein AMJ80_02650 [bacterium SM23_31]|nr:MAG: hypothetical protein AMJ80_02650 [bacterium SM23_31]
MYIKFKLYNLFIIIILCLFDNCNDSKSQQTIVYADIPKEYKKTVKVISTFGDNDILSRPYMIRYNKYDNKIYITDYGSNRIVVFDEELNYLTTFGRFGQGPGEFRNPTGTAFFRDGRILVFDWLNIRYQIFDQNYNHLTTFPIPAFIPPYIFHAVIDTNNIIYINAPDNGSLFTLLKDKGEELNRFGELFPIKIDSTNDNWKSWRREDSAAEYEMDDVTGQIYCAFLNHPVIKVFDSEGNIILEKDISNLGVTISRRIFTEEKRKRERKSSDEFELIMYVTDLSIDEEHVYIHHFDNINKDITEWNRLYAYSKEQLTLQKEIVLDAYIKDKYRNIIEVDFSHPDNIYALSYPNYILLYKK